MKRLLWLVCVSLLGVPSPLLALDSKQVQGEKLIVNSIGMQLTLIPAGKFMMGCGEPAEEAATFFRKNYGMDLTTAEFFEHELPRHQVRISQPFYLGTFHVTRGQFREFVNDTLYETDAEKGETPGAYGWNTKEKKCCYNRDFSWRNAGFEQTDEHPVVEVSWEDATAFCQWLSRREGKTYRLPTEAQWEYACRAGTKTRYSNGDDPEMLAKLGNVADVTIKGRFPDLKETIRASDGYAFTAPVGQFKPNAFGLYDMHGNVMQWCSDWYGGDYYRKSRVDDPEGPDTGNYRVLRGAAWSSRPRDCRSSSRDRYMRNFGINTVGFRVARLCRSAKFPYVCSDK